MPRLFFFVFVFPSVQLNFSPCWADEHCISSGPGQRSPLLFVTNKLPAGNIRHLDLIKISRTAVFFFFVHFRLFPAGSVRSSDMKTTATSSLLLALVACVAVNAVVVVPGTR